MNEGRLIPAQCYALFAIPMLVHMVWAMLGAVYGNPFVSQTFVLRAIVHGFAPAVYAVASIFALIAIAAHKRGAMLLSFFFIVPQQVLLFFSAGGSVASVVLQVYPDGIRDYWHVILRDQCLPIVLAFAHLFVLLEVYAWPVMYQRSLLSRASSSRLRTRS